MTPLVCLVADSDSPLCARVGTQASRLSLETWLEGGGFAADVLVFDLRGDVPAGLADRVVRSTPYDTASVWVMDRPVSIPPAALGKGLPPLIHWWDAPDEFLHWRVQAAGRLVSERRELLKMKEERHSFLALTNHLSVGLFRFRVLTEDDVEVEFFSAVAETLTGITLSEISSAPGLWFDRLLPEDRGPYRMLLTSLRTNPRTEEIHVRMQVGVRLRTLRLRFDAPTPTGYGEVFQGLIEDVTEDYRSRLNGDRALTLLRQLKDGIQFLDALSVVPVADPSFSPRERDVYQLLRMGLSNADIADRLGTKESTIKKHVSSIFDKKGVNSRAQLLSHD